jgi:hypothetical protein
MRVVGIVAKKRAGRQQQTIYAQRKKKGENVVVADHAPPHN